MTIVRARINVSLVRLELPVRADMEPHAGRRFIDVHDRTKEVVKRTVAKGDDDVLSPVTFPCLDV
jgi:hypothetical protein